MTLSPPRHAAPTFGPVVVEPLSAETFASFGRVHAAGPGEPVNQGRGRRTTAPGSLDRDPVAERLVFAVYRADAAALPLAVDVVERHPFSDQLFVPMTSAGYLVAVLPSDAAGRPDWTGLRAFAARPDQAVLYRAGVWHYPLAALGSGADFHMAMWETGRGDDTEIAPAPPALVIGG